MELYSDGSCAINGSSSSQCGRDEGFAECRNGLLVSERNTQKRRSCYNIFIVFFKNFIDKSKNRDAALRIPV
jgi:hypothetical protein